MRVPRPAARITAANFLFSIFIPQFLTAGSSYHVFAFTVKINGTAGFSMFKGDFL
jgi:hypothetical protein